MKKVVFITILALFYTGCASSNVNTAAEVKTQKTQKYAQSMGCSVSKKGYMICPKNVKH
jgi:PBP1b-binding outer membrane lipoprotein LpoB